MRKIDKIIIHCSATVEGVNVSTSTIKRWHVQGRGWSDIGYHYIIGLDGAIDYGRPINRSGAHTKGENETSIGICYIGGLGKSKRAKDTRTEAQKKALIKILKTLTHIYPEASIHSHFEFANKACPCFNSGEEYAELQPKGYKYQKKSKKK
ncbi:MAG: N-acetylmuramoyl-L-alanine amidase [Candidatus Nanoarchaeia archaeon]